MEALSESAVTILGPDGPLAEAWPGYESRTGQLEMAAEVGRAFEQEDIAIIEAGTGTGKTLAYLVPALLSRRKTIVSTGTKNLQEQIYFKDIPFIKTQLKVDFKAAYLKGRENYLCLRMFKEFIREPFFQIPGEVVYLESLAAWAAETETGDRAELSEFPEDFFAWSDVSAQGDRCQGSKCRQFQNCFLQKARRKAAQADLVIVNHHLFMADLSVRDGGFGEVIPEYEAVIFDEAHQMEDVATQHFGTTVSTWRLALLRRDVEKALTRLHLMNPGLGKSLIALKNQTDVLAGQFFRNISEIELWTTDDPDMDRLDKFGVELLAVIEGLAAQLNDIEAADDEIEALSFRTKTIGSDLSLILEGKNTNFVYFAERRGSGLLLHSAPIDVAGFIHDRLFEKGMPIVFTSATLATADSFAFFKERLGILPEVEGVQVGSPYNYESQTLLYVPKPFPYPQSPNYLKALVEEIEDLVNISRGRAFVLFTSYRNMNYVAGELVSRLSWPCLVQGQAPRNVLLERFKSDTDSVLFATHSFWQGVDVPGEALSAVIIDKLPFPRPDRPLVRARSERMRENGQDPFMEYFVPEAVITLKQGLGRLIRSANDKGLLTVLDYRLISKGYGKKFLKSLPESRLTSDIAAVKSFFESF